MGVAVDALREEGVAIDEADPVRLSPLGHDRFNTLILDNTRTTRPGASLGTISRAMARGLWPGRFSLSCPALRI